MTSVASYDLNRDPYRFDVGSITVELQRISDAGGWSGTAADLLAMLSAKFENIPPTPTELWGLLDMLSQITYPYALHCHGKVGELVDIHHGRSDEGCTCRVSASPTYMLHEWVSGGEASETTADAQMAARLSGRETH